MAATRKAKQETNGDGGRERTRRVVLQRKQVLLLPDDWESAAEWVQAIEKVTGAPEPTAEAWVEVGEAVGTKVQAIETHAGKPGTADARVGEFKAVPVRGWQGGAKYVAPPAPLVQREVLR